MVRMAISFTCLVAWAGHAVAGGAEDGRWWPVQALPKGIVRTVPWQHFGTPNKSYQMMVHSVAGLAAKAVNEGRGDELVWVATENPDFEEWLRRMLTSHRQVEERGVFQPWELVDRYVKNGVIKGYILYTQDRSQGEVFTPRPEIDCSVNVATSLAGLLDGILVEEKLEKQAQAHGLKHVVGRPRQEPAVVFRDLQGSVQPALALHAGPASRAGPRFSDRPEGVYHVRPGRASSGGPANGWSPPRRSSAGTWATSSK